MTLDQTISNRTQQCQGLLLLLGGFAFTLGSTMYFTKIFQGHDFALIIGGWSFTIGSILYVIADLQDWFNREKRSIDQSEKHTRKIELYIIGATSGLLFYLAGSILFIPVFERYLIIGEWFFIAGSSVSYLSLFWKWFRTGWKALLNDRCALLMDTFSIVGNILFFIGTICFLPYVNRSDFAENRAAFLFVFGSFAFLLSSLILQYTLYCSKSSHR